MRNLYSEIGITRLNDPHLLKYKVDRVARTNPDVFFILNDPRRKSVYDQTVIALQLTEQLRKKLGLQETTLGIKIDAMVRKSKS
ncbi:hypothetical protein LBMAG10_14180 [Actinomycetes bacterium]|nr:hypothetical protein LBMAG10_14180 [Actinomycetes bacterium]